MTDGYSEGPFTKDEVIAQMGEYYRGEEDCYEWYGFNCIGGFYEMSSGYYRECNCFTAHCVYCLMSCCSLFGSVEDKRKFNRNVVWTGKIELKYLIPTNNKERAALNKIHRRIKKLKLPLGDGLYKYQNNRLRSRRNAKLSELISKYNSNGKIDMNSLRQELQARREKRI